MERQSIKGKSIFRYRRAVGLCLAITLLLTSAGVWSLSAGMTARAAEIIKVYFTLNGKSHTSSYVEVKRNATRSDLQNCAVGSGYFPESSLNSVNYR